jgi:predicted class III extradiol MEMO1 family dioxygenase
METETTKQQLINLILKLNSSDYMHFLSNYSIKDTGRELLEFIEELDEETQEEVINEIYLNTETEY